METKKRRIRRTPDSYRKEVEDITNGEYSVLGEFVNTTTKVLHAHKECGYVWDVRPTDFINGGIRCSVCSGWGRIRTPESYRKEVDEITVGKYTVLGRFKNTTSKILHRHNECGYEWEVRPGHFITSGRRCPICSRRKKRTTARSRRKKRTTASYRREVENLTDGEYRVLGEYVDTNTKIKHLHLVCGTVWEIRPNQFIHKGTRCPICVVSKRFRSPESYKHEVSEITDGEYSVLGDYIKASIKILHKHNECGHEWEITPNHFLHGYRCPNCVYSRGEKAVAVVLDSLSIEYSREHSFKYLGRKRYDFFIPSLNVAIEYDGVQHFEARDFFGGEEALKRTQESDALKNDFCDYMGIDLLRIPYWEFDNIDEIVTNFIDTVKLMRSISVNGSEIAKCR